MKRKLLQLSLSASAVVAMSSCSSSSDENFYGDLEATPMSEVHIGEDMVPPWLLEDSGSAQVAAAPRTPTYNRNDFPIPEPGETVPTTGAAVADSQQSPEIAVDPPTPDPLPATALTPPSIGTYEPSVGSGTITTSTPAAKPKPKPKPKATKKTVKPRKKAPKITKPSLLVYKVRSGDNLSLIAARCGTTVSAIRKASGIKGDRIYAGQTIKVPYTPKAKRHISSRSSKSSSSSTRSSGRTYTVRSGDTISGIAARFGVSYRTVLKHNGMSDADARRLRIGQKIRIPSK